MTAPTPDEAAACDCTSDTELNLTEHARAVQRVIDQAPEAHYAWNRVLVALDHRAHELTSIGAERDALRRDLAAARPVLDFATRMRLGGIAAVLRGVYGHPLDADFLDGLAALSAPVEARPPTLAETRTGTDWRPRCQEEAGTNRYLATRHEYCGTCGAQLRPIPASAEAGATEPAPDRPGICPTCNSAQPHLHPSADLCPDPWHEPVPMTVEGWRREVARWANLLEQISEYEIGNGALDRVAGDMIRALGGAGAPAEPTGDTERGTT